MLCLVLAFVLIESARVTARETSLRIRDRQERLRVLAELIYSISDAQSAERGFLLDGRMEHLQPFDASRVQARALLAELQQAYARRDQLEVPVLAQAGALMTRKFAAMAEAIARVPRNSAAGQAETEWMPELRALLEGVRSRERDRVYADIQTWESQVRIVQVSNASAFTFMLLLLGAIAVLFIRDAERRASYSAQLEAEVGERTRELREVGDYSRRAVERERHRLARELHDELGGTLVGLKMDLAQLARLVDVHQPAAVAQRWEAIQRGLVDGIELKRRVIDELRPTLLDNMGLVTAIQWQAEETCQRAGLRLTTQMPSGPLDIDATVAIELFRILQESLTNIVKHAHAQSVEVSLQVDDGRLVLRIADDGIGLPADYVSRNGSHGLISMKYRAQSVDGDFTVEANHPHGLIIGVSLPYRRPAADGA